MSFTAAIIGRASNDVEIVGKAREAAVALARRGWRILSGGDGPLAEGIRCALLAEGVGGLLVECSAHGGVPSLGHEDVFRLDPGIGYLRNYLLVASAHCVVALGGGAGTLSELAMAWQLHRPTCVFGPDRGWSTVASWWLDHRSVTRIHRAHSIESLVSWADKQLTALRDAAQATSPDTHLSRVAEFFDENCTWEAESSERGDLRTAIPRHFLASMARTGGRAVDLGGGGGVDSVYLAKAGMRVEYIDVSRAIGEICRKRAEAAGVISDITIRTGAWQDVLSTYTDGSIDLLIAMGEAMSFAIRPQDRSLFTSIVSTKLSAGAGILVTADNLYGRAAAHIANGEIERAASLVATQLDSEVSEAFPVYCYSRCELESMIGEAGCRVCTSLVYPVAPGENIEWNLRLGNIREFEASARNVLCVGERV